ncbi:hypothetical protein LIER_41406 [Lithospermum erythrorhizon]|uniref:Uncharacterized protein n=1 Tax=Lithospermum erythrorhizon TaxID=34254 RepID=A0AAV3RAB2_LITER
MFLQSFLHIQTPGLSDHSPLCLSVEPEIVMGPRKPFKYFTFWQDHPSYRGLIEEAWDREVVGLEFDILHSKISHVKEKLVNLNKQHYAELSRKVSNCSGMLQKVQEEIFCGNVLVMERNLCAELDRYSRAELMMLKSKTRPHWLDDEDFGTGFFLEVYYGS